jgi:hypothetical protein
MTDTYTIISRGPRGNVETALEITDLHRFVECANRDGYLIESITNNRTGEIWISGEETE